MKSFKHYSTGSSDGYYKKKQSETGNKNIQRRESYSRNCSDSACFLSRDNRIIRKYNGEIESEVTSNLSKADGMFLAGKPVIIVMIHLGLGYEEVNPYYHEYLYLNIIDILVKITKDPRCFLIFLN